MIPLIETIPIPTIIFNKNFIIEQVNQPCLNFFKISIEEILHREIQSFFPKLDKKTSYFSKKDNLIYQNILNNSGDIKISVENFDKENGLWVLYITGKEIKKHLSFSEKKLNILKKKLLVFDVFFNKINEGVLVFNENGLLQYINNIARKKFQFRKEKEKVYYAWENFGLFISEKDWNSKLIQLKQTEKVEFKLFQNDNFYQIGLYSNEIDDVNFITIVINDITEIEKNRLLIENQNNQINIFHKNIPAAIFQFTVNENKESYFNYVSGSFEEIFGFSLLVNYPEWENRLNLFEEDKKPFLATLKNSIEYLVEFNFTGRLISNDKLIWFEANAIPNLKENNSIIFNGIIHNINNRKKAEQELIESRALNDSILFNIPADIAVFNKHHQYLFINAKGVKNDELREWLIGKTDFDYCDLKGIDKTLAQQRRNYFNLANQTRKEIDWVDEIKNEKGTRFVLRRFYPFYLDNEFAYMIGYGIDVTELKKAQEQVISSQKENELILKSSLDVVILLDNNSKITFWNPQAEAIFGYNEEEVKGKILPETIFATNSNNCKDIENFMNQTINSSHKSSEFIAKKKNGHEFPIELTIVKIEEQIENTHYCVFIRDISSRKEKEIEIERQNAILMEKNKELEQFTYITSHDLQEPLQTLTIYSNLLEEEYGDKLDEEGKLFVQFINKSSKRMRNQIAGLLEYTKLSKKETFEFANCNEIMKYVLEDLNQKIEKYNAKVIVNELPNIECIPLSFKLLLQNLISNGIKFSQKNETPIVQVSAEERKEDWLFEIKDNGIGIDTKNKDKIFLMFQRLHNNEYNGYGIGLTHCKKIVEIHNGTIWFESTLNQGTSFYFTIPKKI